MPSNNASGTIASHQTPPAIVKPTPIRKLPRERGLRVKAYGPLVAKLSFFRRWPEAHARKPTPGKATAPPISSSDQVGFAKSKKSAPQTKPSGTRHRCIHVPRLANRNQSLGNESVRAPQAFRYGVQHPFDIDVHADPLRAGSPVTIFTTVDVSALDANVVRINAAVAPPLGWT